MTVALLVLAALTSTSPPPKTPSPLSPCTLAHPAGLRVHAECGDIDVDVGGVPGKVGFAVVAATSADGVGAPLFLIAGGPGQSATRDFVPILGALAGAGEDRALVLMDVRGTGRSMPLSCQDDRSVADKLAGVGDDDVTRRCMADLPISPAHIGTAEAVSDLEALRARLGAPQIHLLGISYGTRVAAAYAAAHPEHTASIVLDGVVPFDRAVGLDIAIDMSASLRALGDDVIANFVAAKARVADAPVALKVPDPTSGIPTPLSITDDVVNGAIRMMLYADETRALIPVALKSAAAGDFVPLAGMALMTVQSLDGAIHGPVNLAVICAEDVPYFDDADGTAAKTDDDDDGKGTVFDDERSAMRHACTLFPSKPTEPFRPTRIEAPTLLLSGGYDPVTPPRHALRNEVLFPRHRHVIMPHQGHSIVPRSCIGGLVKKTLRAIDDKRPFDEVKAITASCIERDQAFPAFVDTQGPKP